MTQFKPINTLTIPQMLEQSHRLYTSNVAMRYHDGNRFRQITYDGLLLMIRQAAAVLRKVGVKPGDKVAILSENRPAWGATYFASLFIEAVNVPLDALLKVNEWSYILRNSGAKVLVTSSKFYAELEPLVEKIDSLEKIFCMDKVHDACYIFGEDNPPEISAPDVDPDTIAAILYTSGTTGLAKGVMLSHGNVTSDVYGATELIYMSDKDNFLSILPLHHTFECTAGFITPMSKGASITYARGLASKLIIEDIKENKCTVLLAVPLLYEKMYAGIFRKIDQQPSFTKAIFKTIYGVSKFLKKAANIEAGKKLFHGLRDKSGLGTIRLFVSGGAPLSSEVSEAFNTMGFKLIQGYGLTETSPIVTLNPLEKNKYGSIGRAVPNVQLKIDSPNNEGVGELVAKGPMIMKGYYKNDRATSETIKDGWLYTGDLARVDDDGYYFITGRKKNLIVTPGGKNVYPEEIEITLNNSPYILESLVLGRKLRGGGEEIEAIIVPDLDYFGLRAEEKGISLSQMHIEQTIKLEVAKQCEQLADYKRVKYMKIRDEDFEKTSTRKIKRYLYELKPMTLNKGKDEDRKG